MKAPHKCTNCGTSVLVIASDEYEAKLSEIVKQIGDYPSSGLQIDVEREDGTVERTTLAPMEGSPPFACPRCGKKNIPPGLAR